MKKRKFGFTLVELIIVITILVILATIGFLNFGNYPGISRDTLRISDLKNIEKSLVLNQIEKGKFPIPENPQEEQNIDGVEGIKWIKGKFGEEQLKEIKRISKLPVDPKTKEKYDYYVSSDKKFYILEGIKEITGEKIIFSNYKFKNGALNNTKISETKKLNIPPNARLFGKVITETNLGEERTCSKDAGDRFTINKETIFDNLTGLYWEREILSEKVTFEVSKNNCNNLVKGGYDDWRLPDMSELMTIINYSCYSPFKFDGFNIIGDIYWSSSARYNSVLGISCDIDFGFGKISCIYNNSKKNYYICVR